MYLVFTIGECDGGGGILWFDWLGLKNHLFKTLKNRMLFFRFEFLII
jgi:hypothetical protein